ncbi:MAG: hypothetical protein IJH34_13180, partial [Romboutsia sp.]|nr:hypothetical protein [Romboutsia sp.]
MLFMLNIGIVNSNAIQNINNSKVDYTNKSDNVILQPIKTTYDMLDNSSNDSYKYIENTKSIKSTNIIDNVYISIIIFIIVLLSFIYFIISLLTYKKINIHDDNSHLINT